MASAAEVGAMGHPARRLNNDPLFITRALSSVRLDDNQSTGSLRTSDSGLPPRPMRLDLERLNSQMSQDFLW